MIQVFSFWAGVLILLLGLGFCFKDMIRILGVAFLILTGTISWWLIIFSLMQGASGEAQALVLARCAYLVIPFIAPAVYLFDIVLLRQSSHFLHRIWLLILWMTAFAFAASSQSGPLLLSGIKRQPWGFYPEYGVLGWPFAIVFVITIGVPLVAVWNRRKQTDQPKRKRSLKWVIVSFAVCYFGIFDFVPKLCPDVPEWLAGLDPILVDLAYPWGFVFVCGFILINAWIMYKGFFYVVPTADEILARILPDWVVRQIEEGKENVFRHEDAAILFADIVDFAKNMQDLSAAEQVDFVGRLFTVFDDLALKNQVDRVKTIGDGYMAVAWEKLEGADRGTVRLARMAVKMMESVSKNQTVRLPNGTTVTLRIGMHKGLVTGGAAGAKRLAYDVWGTAVNLASRMESKGERGKVAITKEVKDDIEAALGRGREFEFIGPDEIEPKGFEKVSRWFLNTIDSKCGPQQAN